MISRPGAAKSRGYLAWAFSGLMLHVASRHHFYSDGRPLVDAAFPEQRALSLEAARLILLSSSCLVDLEKATGLPTQCSSRRLGFVEDARFGPPKPAHLL